ncbi:MAG TPA: hypothetical protein VFK52_05785 [Nocardioidaceae bacterium]|nr:hypothetical protein [Nocardioidaceae bacterium]
MTATLPVAIDELVVADDPSAWAAAGFTVEGDLCRVGTVRIRLVGAGRERGVLSWSLSGIAGSVTDVDGLPTSASVRPPADPAEHPLGITHLDHLVLSTPDLVRTEAALAAIGLSARRHRDTELGGAPLRQVFYRMNEVILEVIGAPDVAGEGPASFWGLTHAVTDIDAAAALLGERTGRVKDAVQKGRRITTLRHRELGISVATALISQQ